ncbi:hypothetical protein ACJMK2_019032 [Sinanodonta woodiana]|uniref:RZ-type domain-containing protein n=1 Tax=Sinanodonta woodiana TaxID=1069815 RepID=A0ABD3UIL3_SINWO
MADRRRRGVRGQERPRERLANPEMDRPGRHPEDQEINELNRPNRNVRLMDRGARGRGGRGGMGRAVGRGGQAHERGRGRERGVGENRGVDGANRLRGNRYIGFMRLRELADEEPSEIVHVLAAAVDNGTFRRSLYRCSEDSGYFKQFLRVLAKACECHSMDANMLLVLNNARDDSFTNTMVDYTTLAFRDVCEGDMRKHVQQMKDLISVAQQICIRMPSSTLTLCLGLYAAIQPVVDAMVNSSDTIDDSLQQQFQTFTEHKNNMLKRGSKTVSCPEGEPEDDFREYEIFPRSVELDTNVKPFLRKNKKKGGYQDLDQYLDIQYRLLREDFVGPLRDGIAEFMQVVKENRKAKRFQDVRIYNHVRIISPICSDSGLSHALQFDVSHMRVRWESSKRLIHGSLLCLSADLFETFYFATVTNRDPKDLQKGILHVKIEHDFDTIRKLQKMEFTMAETTAYFEAYRHVLAGLQNIHEGDLPFEKYIVRCETDVNPPLYLRNNPHIKFDLRPIVDDNFIIREESKLTAETRPMRAQNDSFSADSRPAKDVRLLDRSSWPPTGLLHLNSSQYEAVISALTKEFVIAQGPPGTGKTYIGLKIVKALLYNRDVWSKNADNGNPDPRPMLIVCYTNHALDQFLEGIYKFYKGDVVRVGSRSTSEILQKCMLKNFRGRIGNDALFRNKRAAREVLSDLKKNCDAIGERIKEAQTEILHEDFLRPFMDKAYMQLTGGFNDLLYMYPEVKFQLPKRYSVIVEWLGLGNVTPEIEVDENAEAREQNPGPVNNAGRENDRRQDQAIDREIVRAVMEELGDENQDNNFIDVEDELNAIANQRIIDDGEISDDDESPRAHISLFEEHHPLSLTAVAFHVDDIDKKPEGTIKRVWEVQKEQKKKIKKRVRHELAQNDMMSKAETDRLQNLWTLRQKDKWRLYRRWIFLYKESLLKKINPVEIDNAARRYSELRMQEDKEIMRRATVVGMTTTGAAIYHSVLQEIRPRIIVVEEAAEVLEAHVITTLSSGCEHLILIGDHKQLKPNPTVFKLAKDYNLDLSLFERMIKNKMEWDCLHLQHRMRPDIADLVRHIYPKLEDHESVNNVELIKGVSSFMYFIDHTYPEQHDEDQKSHLNTHEAEYIVAFCRYLLQQGYESSQITILTLYSGQLFCLRKLMPRSAFEGVRVTVVDNYQGEENDIIILSLVRSNNEGHIGFLSIENRICVALSRAKKGFYVIGNFDLLSKNSELWKQMVLTVKKKGLFGPGLKLYCQNHPKEEGITVSLPKDFNKAPEGGCSKQCEYRLNCGHVCQMFCHVLNPEHKDYMCRKPCGKIVCANDHICTKLCYEKCGNCMKQIPKIIPRCGHEQKVQCHLNPSKFSCQAPCEKILSCGHKCVEKCGDVHTRECIVKVQKTWACGHTGVVSCSKKDVATCKLRCREVLTCEHPCEGTCGDCSEGRLHTQCMKNCRRTLVCGHQCKDRCNNCPPCTMLCENRCSHSRCTKSCGEACVPCRELCDWSCEHYTCTRPCFEPCTRPRCDHPCRKRLPCHHACIGLCGEPCPDMCRVCHRDEVTQIFFGSEDEPNARFVQLEDCKHIFEVASLDTWMDGSGENNGETTIQLKLCPRCKTPIRKNLRYGHIIKRALCDIEKVKTVVRGDEKRINELKMDIDAKIKLSFRITKHVQEYNALEILRDAAKSERELVALNNQIRFLIAVKKLQEKWEEDNDVNLALDKQNALHDLHIFQDWILIRRNVLADQEIDDAQQELVRLKSYFILMQYSKKIRERRVKIDEVMKMEMENVEKIVKSGKKITPDRKQLVKACLNKLKTICPLSGLGISEEEKTAILKAMDLSKGHWFKCPKGHIYAIGDCGGATVESKCPECGATIGGQGHALRADNAVATEMDGANMSAYDAAANMNLADLLLHRHLRL